MNTEKIATPKGFEESLKKHITIDATSSQFMEVNIYFEKVKVEFSFDDINRPFFFDNQNPNKTPDECKRKWVSYYFEDKPLTKTLFYEKNDMIAYIYVNKDNKKDWEYYRQRGYIRTIIEGIEKFYFITQVLIVDKDRVMFSLFLDSSTSYLDKLNFKQKKMAIVNRKMINRFKKIPISKKSKYEYKFNFGNKDSPFLLEDNFNIPDLLIPKKHKLNDTFIIHAKGNDFMKATKEPNTGLYTSALVKLTQQWLSVKTLAEWQDDQRTVYFPYPDNGLEYSGEYIDDYIRKMGFMFNQKDYPVPWALLPLTWKGLKYRDGEGVKGIANVYDLFNGTHYEWYEEKPTKRVFHQMNIVNKILSINFTFFPPSVFPYLIKQPKTSGFISDVAPLNSEDYSKIVYDDKTVEYGDVWWVARNRPDNIGNVNVVSDKYKGKFKESELDILTLKDINYKIKYANVNFPRDIRLEPKLETSQFKQLLLKDVYGNSVEIRREFLDIVDDKTVLITGQQTFSFTEPFITIIVENGIYNELQDNSNVYRFPTLISLPSFSASFTQYMDTNISQLNTGFKGIDIQESQGYTRIAFNVGTSAAAGAAAGSMVGPIGTAGGAGIGALVGLGTGIMNAIFNRQNATQKRRVLNSKLEDIRRQGAVVRNNSPEVPWNLGLVKNLLKDKGSYFFTTVRELPEITKQTIADYYTQFGYKCGILTDITGYRDLVIRSIFNYWEIEEFQHLIDRDDVPILALQELNLMMGNVRFWNTKADGSIDMNNYSNENWEQDIIDNNKMKKNDIIKKTHKKVVKKGSNNGK
jgi:hypothetical protein